MPYQGNILRTQAFDQRKLPFPDPAHGQGATDPFAAKWTSPAGTAVTEGDFPNQVTNVPGLTLDTPSFSHDGPALLQSYPDNSQWQEDLSLAHDGSHDHGWVRSQYHPPELQDSFTDYGEQITQGFGPTALNPVILQRGRNSNAANNPPVEGYDPGGYRYGFQRLKTAWRQRQMNMQRSYDMQPIWDRSNLTIANVPPPANPQPWSPFADSMASGFTRRIAVPAMAQQPVDMVDADLAAAPVYGSGSDSVIGLGF